ncbi:MAG: hypothetical protein Q4E57_02245 [Eubacteriales bacterium]|nr:hypothetical protein [Eubacteriales bacterium]
MTESGYSKSKVYVDVRVDFDRYGHMTPASITWEDGTTYEIDKLIDLRSAYSAKAGGHGDMYLIKVRNSLCHLFFERNPYRSGASLGRWFVSKNIP